MSKNLVKIGILTLQGNNYGAVLQATALNKFLTLKGYDVENINYNDKSRVISSLSFKKKVLNWIWVKFVCCFCGGKLKSKRFNEFRETQIINSDKKWSSRSALLSNPPIYDIFISGSDQIWNPNVINGDYSYLLDFVKAKRKIAYASSFGIGEIDINLQDKYKELLKSFTKIGVREDSGKKIINSFGLKADVVCDPTLLLNKEDWKLMAHAIDVPDHYILCYYMPGDKEVNKKIAQISRHLSKNTGYHVINLGLKEYHRFNPKIDYRCDAGPAEFLFLFLNCDYVVTNSFHGTAFATNFGKKLAVVINDYLPAEKTRHIRMVDYLYSIKAADSIFYVSKRIDKQLFDTTVIQSEIENLREKSIEFLTKALEV